MNRIILSILALVAWSAAGGAQELRRFSFDGGFNQTGGLGFSFDRDVDTLDWEGMPIAIDEPRFADERLVCGALGETTTHLTPNSESLMFSAHGVDSDSSTPLTAVFAKVMQELVIFRGEPPVEVARRRLRNFGSVEYFDLLDGADPDRAYRPRSAVVCHGMIMAWCDVMTRIGGDGSWKVRRSAVLTSQDLGATWDIIYERPSDYAEAEQRIVCSTWSFQNWWALEDSGSPPTKVWFAPVDYRSVPKDGGDLILIRATRAGVGMPWQIDPQLDVERVLTKDDDPGMHFHCAAVLRHGAGGLAVYVIVGDRPQDGIYKLCRDDENFTQGPALWGHDTSQNGWTLFEAHGPRTANVVDLDGSPIVAPRRANQGVGLAQGPDPKSFLLCGDEQSIGIVRVDHDDRPDTGLTQTIVFNPTTQAHGRWVSFKMHNLDAAQGGPWVANAQHVATPGYDAGGTCAVFSPDGRHFGVFAPPMKASNKESGLTPGRYWWNDGLDLFSVPTPAWRLQRPLMVGPGGTNLLPDNITSTFAAEDGVFRTEMTGTPLDVPPVQSFSDQSFVFECDSALNVDFGQYRLSSGAPFMRFDSLHVKYHHYVYGYDGGTAGGYDLSAPGQGSNPRASNWLCSPIFETTVPDGPKSPKLGTTTFTVCDGWVPLATATTLLDWPDNFIGLSEMFDIDAKMQGGPVGEGCWNKSVLVFESVSIDDYLGYPIRCGETGPDEIAEVTDLGGMDSWTVYAAGLIPPDNFDFELGLDEKRILSLAEPGGGFIDIVAKPRSDALEIEVFHPLFGDDPMSTSVVSGLSFKREHPLLLAITKERDQLAVRIAMDGQPIKRVIRTIPLWRVLGFDADRMRFGTSSTSRRSASFWWFGGGIDPDGSDDDATIDGRLRSLDFLASAPDHPTGPTCDMDGNGSIDMIDLLSYLDAWLDGEPHAEFDLRPGLDISDLLYFLDCWLSVS